ncbi:MAG: DUF4389 domain-containing protein [Actinobacteria bacterium]|nr:DUF4389 domain-containing protein [Actinomycetota bacterium]
MSKKVKTNIDVQIKNRNRTTVFFRGVIAFPAMVYVASFAPLIHVGWSFGGVVVVPVALAIIFRGVYPSYALKFNHALFELNTRLTAYILFLTDDYPSIEANGRISVELPDIDGGKKLNRVLPIIKWLLAIPLYIVGIVYVVASILVTVIAWVSIIITGRYPRWAEGIVVGTISFWNRVIGYCAILVTDKYPSFSL